MSPTRRNRGAVLVLTGFILLASVGLAVVAIDLGHLSVVAGEVQTLEDAAAVGAARSMIPVGDVECNGKFNKQKTVLGFATIHVTGVTPRAARSAST